MLLLLSLLLFSTALVAPGSLVAVAEAAYPLPGACSGTCTNTHDPSVIRGSDGTYYRFSSGGKVQIHSAPAITGPWKFQCTMLRTNAMLTTSANSGGDLWAPDVSLVGSTYYVYYSVSSFGTANSMIGYATSTTLKCGSFTDHGATGVSSSSASAGYNAIDPALLNDNGVFHLTFGSFWNDIYQVPMSSPPTKAAAGSPVQLSFDPAGSHAEEGAFLIKQGGHYYLFFSRGICCKFDKEMPAAGQEYQINVCRSTSPNSGFVDATGKSCLNGGGTVILASHGNIYGGGGQSVYNDPINGWIIVYHYVDTKIGYADGDKQFGWNKLDFSSGWPVLV